MKVSYDDHGAVKSVDIISTSGAALLDTTAKNFVQPLAKSFQGKPDHKLHHY